MASLGCKTQPHVNAHIESVNAEYRQLEDYVYSLEEENAKLQQELDAARTLAQTGALPGANPPPRGGLFRRSPPAGTPRRSPAADPPPTLDGPVIELPSDTPPARIPGARSTFHRPGLDLPEPTAPADTPPNIDPPRPSPATPPPASSHELLPVPGERPRGVALPAPPETIPVKPADKKVTHLYLNPALTGGSDFDGQPGDDGLSIVVEPRNSVDQYVSEAGALSVVLLDPNRDGDAARVARWDFDLSATRQMLAASSPGRGLKLEMPWPVAAPSANRLKLFVRYETPDGRHLQTDREIFLTQPVKAVSGWTPRASEAK